MGLKHAGDKKRIARKLQHLSTRVFGSGTDNHACGLECCDRRFARCEIAEVHPGKGFGASCVKAGALCRYDQSFLAVQ